MKPVNAVLLNFRFFWPIQSYVPRACDCDFRFERKIAYLSDPESRLIINSKSKLKKYQQGSD